MTLLVTLLGGPGAPEADLRLLQGARAFREARYEEALVEFRVALALGAAPAGPYLAATLVQLRRPEEAVEAFAASGAERDVLLDYYFAIACYEANLYLAADRLLVRVAARAGPRLAERAERIRAAIALASASEPETASVDWYLQRCGERRAAGRAALASAYCREAAELAGRRADGYRRSEAERMLAGLAPSTGAGVAR